jgi:hypothetical protein
MAAHGDAHITIVMEPTRFLGYLIRGDLSELDRDDAGMLFIDLERSNSVVYFGLHIGTVQPPETHPVASSPRLSSSRLITSTSHVQEE